MIWQVIVFFNCSARAELGCPFLQPSIAFFFSTALQPPLTGTGRPLSATACCLILSQCQMFYCYTPLPGTNFCFVFQLLYNRPLQSLVAYKKSPTVINSETSLGIGGFPFCPLPHKSNATDVAVTRGWKIADSRTGAQKLQDKPGTSCCVRI